MLFDNQYTRARLHDIISNYTIIKNMLTIDQLEDKCFLAYLHGK